MEDTDGLFIGLVTFLPKVLWLQWVKMSTVWLRSLIIFIGTQIAMAQA